MNIRQVLTVLVCLGIASGAFAQQAGLGSITGVVQDASGAVVPAAKVTVANESKGITRSIETNAEGIFTAPSLTPAAGYVVRVEAPGFAAYERPEIQLQVGQQLNLDIALSVTGAAQTVEVTSGAPIIETTKIGVSQVVNTAQIDNLPINGRRVDSFVLLTPGVTNDGTFGLISFRGVAGGNTYLTDGNDTTQGLYNENAGRTRIATQISQDAVQEFQVLSNGFSAEYGRAIGGVVNTVTRSGSNDVHGTGYWFFRNRTLNARDRYAAINPPEWRHQAGASLGGPIKKDKLFYFFNAETTRRSYPGFNRIINNAFTDTIGNFTGVCPAPLTAAQCDNARAYMFRENDTIIARKSDSNLYFGKLDYQINERNSISASFNYMDWIAPNGIQSQAAVTNNSLVSNNANSSVRTRYGRLAWTAVPSNNMVNELRFGWFKDRLFDEVNPEFIPAFTGQLGVSVASTNVGTATDYPRLNPSEQRFQIADNLSWNLGRHSLKFGVDIMSTQDYQRIIRNQWGSYTYPTFQSFALDFNGVPSATGLPNYQQYTHTFGNPVLDFTTKDYGFYIQDQFRATSKLTLNMGLRYEYTDIPQPQTPNPDFPQTSRINSPTKNFAPRGSLSYAFGDKTVLRAGFGVFFARFHGAVIQTLNFSNGVYQPSVTVFPTTPGAPTFPNRLTGLQGLPTGSVSTFFASPDFRNPYTLQGDLSVERQLAANLGLTLSYVYSRGVHLFTNRDLNIGAPGPDITYRINDASGNQVGTFATPGYLTANRVNTRYQRVMQIENGGQSWYNGFVAQLNKRFSHGLQGSIAYTWSHAIDLNMGQGNNALTFDFPRTYRDGDNGAEKGSSALDQRHRLVMNSVWSPRFTKSTSWAARYLINGWQLSQITTIASPQFATATVRVSNATYTGMPFTNTLNGYGGTFRVPFLPSNTLKTDSIQRVDARLSRELPFTERVRLWLNFEAFNVFNNVYDTQVSADAYTATRDTTNTFNGILNPLPAVGSGTASGGFPDGTNARRAQVSLRLVF